MNWEKIKPVHFFKDPVEHFYTSSIFDMTEYDRLYENQNNLSHRVWQEFDRKYKTGFQFCEDLRELDKKKEIICLWFFKERTDRTAGEEIDLAGKILQYTPNTFLMTKSKDIKILERKKRIHNRRPFVQLDIAQRTYEDLLKRFNKTS